MIGSASIPPAKIKLDRIDRRILAELQQNARITNQRLSEKVGLSPSPCLQRVKKLEQAGLIGPYLARINLDKLCSHIVVIAAVTLRSHDDKGFRDFEASIRDVPEVVECIKVSGAFDYYLRFVCSDIGRYHELSDELLKVVPVIAQLSSHVVLAQTKPFTGLPLDHLL